MDFYHRKPELQLLETLWEQARVESSMTVLIGRRRIGKTTLALKFSEDKPSLYFFVSRKAEGLLCEHYTELIREKLGLTIHGSITSFQKIFELLLTYAKDHHFTLIIDEFQEFFRINPAVYSDIQYLWDLNKSKTKMNLIFIGSIAPMMHKIFENQEEPLFGRANRIIRIKPFTIPQMKLICSDYKISRLQSLFDFYVLTGGVPKYLDILLTNKCKNLDSAIDYMIQENSPFINEGKNQLIEEFGKEYTIYFSILELIASGKTSSSEMASIIQKNVSAYLDRLEKDYSVIQKVKPINTKPGSKLQKYVIIDKFLSFWFRFIYRNQDAIEIQNYSFIKEEIKDTYSDYTGRVLEKFLMTLIAQTGKYNRIGPYWEKAGKNEIDIVAINDREKTLFIAEVKTNKRRASINQLQQRATKILKQYQDYEPEFAILDLNDAKKYL